MVLVVLQGVRADHLGAYGYSEPTTPALDALAGQGVVFDRAFTSSSDSLAAMASLLTGRYPLEHGLLYSRELHASIVTLPAHLAGQGYQTHLVSSDPALSDVKGLTDGFQGVEVVNPAETALLDGGTAEVTDRAIAWLREGHDSTEPFLLTLVYSGATLPFDPPEPYDTRFIESWMAKDALDRTSGFWLPMARRINSGELRMGDADRQVFAALYDGEVAYLDEKIGEVLRTLEDQRLTGRTWVVVTADRGEDLGENGKIADASSLTEAVLQVPLIIRRPAGGEGGIRADGLIQDVDIVPTLCDLLGLAPPETVGGAAVSHAPLDGAARRADAVSVAVRPVGPRLLELGMSLRDERYRYLLAPQGPVSLLDTEADQEAREILQSSPEIARQLQARLGAWHGKLEPPPGGELQPAPPPTAVEP